MSPSPLEDYVTTKTVVITFSARQIFTTYCMPPQVCYVIIFSLFTHNIQYDLLFFILFSPFSLNIQYHSKNDPAVSIFFKF